jgi:hypothetical protein
VHDGHLESSLNTSSWHIAMPGRGDHLITHLGLLYIKTVPTLCTG